MKKPLPVWTTFEMNSHTKNLFLPKVNENHLNFFGFPNSQALKKSWREQNHFLAPMADRLGKNRWNYLKFYTMIGLLLTLASRGLHFFLATRQLFTRFSVWAARLGRLNQMANFQRGQQNRAPSPKTEEFCFFLLHQPLSYI